MLIVIVVYLLQVYRRLLSVVDIDEHSLNYCASHWSSDVSCQDGGSRFVDNSYNVILTSEYMIVVPRSLPNAGLNINAMGFLGLLLAHEPERNDILRFVDVIFSEFVY